MRVLVLLLSACVPQSEPLAYAQRAYPECSGFQVLAHQLSDVSLTEVSMTCDGVTRSVTVKCQIGGLFSDTTCYINN